MKFPIFALVALAATSGCNERSAPTGGPSPAAEAQAAARVCLEKLESTEPAPGWTCLGERLVEAPCRDAWKAGGTDPDWKALGKLAEVCATSYCARLGEARPLQCAAPGVAGQDAQTISNVGELLAAALARDVGLDEHRLRLAILRYVSHSTGEVRSMVPMPGKTAERIAVTLAEGGEPRLGGKPVPWQEIPEELARAKAANPEAIVALPREAPAAESVRLVALAHKARMRVVVVP